MKVFHITQLLEVDKIEPTLTGRDTSVAAPKDVTSVKIEKSQVLGTDGKPQFKVVDQAGKTLFVGTEEAANAKYDEINKSIKTPAAATPEKPMAAGPRDGTPTSDQLTARERRTIAKGGNITRTVSGQKMTFNAKNIADADALSKVKLPGMSGDTKPTDAKSAPDKGGGIKAEAEDMKKGIVKKYVSYVRTLAMPWFGGVITNAIVKAIDVAAIAEAHNAYFTSLAQLGDAKTSQDRKKIEDEMQQIRKTQIIGPVTDLFIGSWGTAITGGSILSAVGGGVSAGVVDTGEKARNKWNAKNIGKIAKKAAPRVVATVAGVLVTGTMATVASWLVPVLIGGALIYGAYEGAIFASKKFPMPGIGGGQSIYEFTYQKFEKEWLTDKFLQDFAAENGSTHFLQLTYGYTMDPLKRQMSPLTPTSPPAVDLLDIGNKAKSFFVDSVVREEDEEDEETMSKGGGSAKSAVMSDPDLKKLFLIGKAEIKTQERDATTAS